ncbi:MAG: methionine--tRNA ligase [Candidatus Falkowbacteria bacterium]|nr:methionine--tRNA ligase [Candidatus Falkowbacteria bacterium]
MNKKILVAAAWPYANGSLHLGHVAGLIGADILARFQRLNGADVLYVSGSDCHGTPISVEAEKQGVPPLEIAEKYHAEFVETLIKGLNFSYDNYTNTLTENHKQVVQEMFLNLYEKKLIYKKTEDLPYCPTCQRFLPDRYIEGTCPYCNFDPARGDQCDNCGKMLDAKELIKPRCKICGTKPEWRPSEHFFLKLSALAKDLKKWLGEEKGWRGNSYNFTKNLLASGLPDRAITRDLDWGIELPLPGYETKRIYVWFEAVCGYLSASKEWAAETGRPDAWQEFWENKKAYHYYVHGKDNIPFHTIIWPAMLIGASDSKLAYNLPDMIVSSEYLTLEHKQFSKSRKWAVWLPDFLSRYQADTLRYYLIISGPETSDADFSWQEFYLKTNNELISTFGNFVNRVFSLTEKNFPAGLNWPKKIDISGQELLQLVKETFKEAGASIEKANFREALRTIFRLIDEANAYVNKTSPWLSLKRDKAKAEADLAVLAFVVRSLAVLLYPYLPTTCESIAQTLGFNLKETKWEYPNADFTKVGEFMPLFRKLSEAEITAEVERLGK